MRSPALLGLLGAALAACGGEDDSEVGEPPLDPYASALFAFDPGPGSGFGADGLPEVVLGPPSATGAPSLDVVSLGVEGTLAVDFGPDRRLVDGPGPDLVVFENPFWIGGDPTQPFAELAEVAVSADGETWHGFPCQSDGDGMGRYPGCAGWSPTREFDPGAVRPLDPELTGGDRFDLADIGVTEARYVRVRDLGTSDPSGPTAGFDLDAVGAAHLARR